MDIKIIEYIVFFSMAIITIILAIRFKPTPQEETTYVPDYWRCESPIERRVYQGLVQHGLYPVPQYKQGRYRIDLAFPGSLLAIECDGKAYHSSPEQKAHDRKKDRFLRSKGWTVLRFTGTKIHRDLPGVVSKIKDNLN
ncbi:endonuclease domain-containing protein [Oceanobacillus chungangensis]|uniref:Restriction endonuclease type II-like domain-containing protein n=1 Tax=Oceanobacillus chungangensis TaxID=1229152 RepID=A0A3D8PL86_9BACI|nr:DUF559 domain-containing protein [Oceanobacillus chungangensis]RDW15945.1 hypothetical protein CWR45_15735 [Oceanobacillus chungangensis]